MNHASALLDLEMCKGELVPDVMHDLLEGVLQTEVKHLLLYCTGKHLSFSATEYNCVIMESDRPTPIDRKTLYSESNLLKQKGNVHVNYYCIIHPNSCTNVGIGTLFANTSW